MCEAPEGPFRQMGPVPFFGSNQEGFSIMRWIMSLAALTLVQPALAQENEAEKLYRKVEQQIRSAKSIKVVFEADAQFGKEQTVKSKGLYAAAEGNKGRIELATTRDGKTESALMIADGKETRSSNILCRRPSLRS